MRIVDSHSLRRAGVFALSMLMSLGACSSPTASGDVDGSAGTGGATRTGGSFGTSKGGTTGGAGVGGASGSGVAKPPCLANPSDGVIIGDSYITGFLSPAFQPALGALYATANQFRNYAVAGTSMASGGIGTIPPQLDQAVRANPTMKLVIMSGGGNDILLCDSIKYPGCADTCKVAGSSKQKVCTDIVSTALTASEQLLMRMADAGVKDIVFFFYPHITASSGGYKEILDYSSPLAKASCEAARARSGGRVTCHFIDLIPPFAAAGGDLNVANFALDGIHPSQAGQNIIAREVWTVMQDHCLGQPSSAGCCTP
jgi:lysophospholipase L1-like esterase